MYKALIVIIVNVIAYTVMLIQILYYTKLFNYILNIYIILNIILYNTVEQTFQHTSEENGVNEKQPLLSRPSLMDVTSYRSVSTYHQKNIENEKVKNVSKE